MGAAGNVYHKQQSPVTTLQKSHVIEEQPEVDQRPSTSFVGAFQITLNVSTRMPLMRIYGRKHNHWPTALLPRTAVLEW